MNTLFIGKSISVLSNSVSSEAFVLIAFVMPMMIVFLIDHRVYKPPTTIAPTPTYRICSAHIAKNFSTSFPVVPQPFIKPYMGTKIPNPITPPKNMNEAIRIPTINPTESNAIDRSIPAYSLVPRKENAPSTV